MKVEIKFCPNCKNELSENNKLAQGVKECKKCNAKFFILICQVGY